MMLETIRKIFENLGHELDRVNQKAGNDHPVSREAGISPLILLTDFLTGEAGHLGKAW
jgi:hypothetical protein